MIRTAVSILLVVETAVLFRFGATWIVPHLVALTIAAGLAAPRLPRWLRIVITVIAAGYAVLFVFPGGVWLLAGSCGGAMSSTCSNAEFYLGVAAYAAAIAVNITAAVLLLLSIGRGAATPRQPAEPRR